MLLFPIHSRSFLIRDIEENLLIMKEKEVFMTKKKKRNKKPDGKQKTLRWHYGFYAGIQIEFREESDQLDFRQEVILGSEPVRSDMIIIKKEPGRPIRKNIGRIFRRYNIIEYKSPDHSLTIADFYKVCAYAFLYKSLGKNKVMIEDMTISLFCSHYPHKLAKHLRKIWNFTFEKQSEGIYIVKGSVIPIQIVLLNLLPQEENIWLSSLTNRMEDITSAEKLAEAYEPHVNEPLYRQVMDLIVEANEKMFSREVKDMSEALAKIFEEVWKDRVDEMKRKAVCEGRQEGIREGRQEGIREGRQEGICEGLQSVLMEVLGELGPVSIKLYRRISDQKDIETLKQWSRFAATARSIEDFEKKISI